MPQPEIRPHPQSPNGIARAIEEAQELAKSSGKVQTVTYDTARGNHPLGGSSDPTKVLPHESNMGAADATDPVSVANAGYAESIRNYAGRQDALKKAIAERERLRSGRARLLDTLKKSIADEIHRNS